MVKKLSTFLGTSFSDQADSATIRSIVQSETILLDSGTSGDYVKSLTAGYGTLVTGTGHAADAQVTVNTSLIASVSGVQSLTNKTINLANNTVVSTLATLNAAVSDATLVSLGGTETLTNKTLTSPAINTPTITGPGSIVSISTFGLRDTIVTTYDTRIVSTSSTNLSANRTLTLDVKNGSRTLSLQGNFILGGGYNATLNTTATTLLTLPTSGTLISKDAGGDFTIAGTMTGEVNRDAYTTVAAGTYGSASLVPIITVDANGFIDSIGTTNVAGVVTFGFDSANATLTIGTADGGAFRSRIGLSGFTSTNLAEGTNLYYTNARARSALSVTDAGGDGSLAYNSGSGVITYTGPSAAQVRAHLSATGSLNYNSSTGVFSITETYSTPSSLLTALLTVDGVGSGLDADLLDGQSGAYYRLNVYNSAGTLLN